jgi:hypothetical protein
VFDCKFCDEQHAPSGKEGFLLNGGLIKLIHAKVGNVYRNAKVEELKTQLAEIKIKSEGFKVSFNNAVDEVKALHCIRLRNQVHLETDILIEEAHKFNESLIAEIDKYEQDCVESFQNNITKYNKIITNLRSSYLNWILFTQGKPSTWPSLK